MILEILKLYSLDFWMYLLRLIFVFTNLSWLNIYYKWHHSLHFWWYCFCLLLLWQFVFNQYIYTSFQSYVSSHSKLSLRRCHCTIRVLRVLWHFISIYHACILLFFDENLFTIVFLLSARWSCKGKSVFSLQYLLQYLCITNILLLLGFMLRLLSLICNIVKIGFVLWIWLRKK